MKDLSFFDVRAEYVNYLRNFETSIRGFSHVPLVDYESHNRKGKFFCGIVLQINDYQYYVPVSSNTRDHPNTFFLYDNYNRIGSLRFDFMFPVPEGVVKERLIREEADPRYQRLLEKELTYCKRNVSAIREMALQTYMTITLPGQGIEPRHLTRSCDFRVLEGASAIWCQEHGLSQETLEPSIEMLRQSRPRTLEEIVASATARAAEINAVRGTVQGGRWRTEEDHQHE